MLSVKSILSIYITEAVVALTFVIVVVNMVY